MLPFKYEAQERSEYLKRDGELTSRVPRIRSGPEDRDYVYDEQHVGHHLWMNEEETERYKNGDLGYFIEAKRPVTALLAYLNQQNVIFHHKDMVEVTQSIVEGKSLLKVYFSDSLGKNNVKIDAWAMHWNPKRPEEREIFPIGFPKPHY